jgi:superfamily II DNA or RNA helicase
MAALDVKMHRPSRVLFIVHREQILAAAKTAFAEIIPERSDQMGLLTGNVKEPHKEILFSTNLTMSKHLSDYPKDYFDYVVIDEAHHATSPSWQTVIQHFQPKFLLGMTATPERSDGNDIFNFFDNNIAVELRLRGALEENLVVPFHYFGISDETVDLHDVNLNEVDKIAKLLQINRRVDFVIEKMNFYGHDGLKRKTVGFCANQEHAAFMAKEFNERGIKSVALNASNSIEERKHFVSRLENDDDDLEVIFTADIFNEGVDIPGINCILMLRPTSSPIVFIQQLGRGLRKAKNKEFLTVIDFIGNHAKTFLIAMALCGARAYDNDSLKKAVATDFSDIPGCTNVRIDKISKERILKQIEQTNFNAIKFLKEEYFEFKTLNRNKIPTLVDFIKYDGAPNPLKFINYSYSYPEFVTKVDNSATEYKNLNVNLPFIKLLRQLSNELPIKRPYEFAILEYLLENEHLDFERAKSVVSKYISRIDEDTLHHSFRFLTGSFDDANDQRVKLPILQLVGSRLIRLEPFNELLSDEKTKEALADIIRFALLRYEEEFGNEDYGMPFFKLYRSLTRAIWHCFRITTKSTAPSTDLGFSFRFQERSLSDRRAA